MKKIIAMILLAGCITSQAQKRETIYDEDQVPVFTLPSLLEDGEGSKVTSTKKWEKECRPKILKAFASQMYGITPDEKVDVSYELLSNRPDALDGLATCKQIKLVFTNGDSCCEMLLLIYLPNNVEGKVPLFLSCNFSGNETIHYDPMIIPSFTRGKNPEQRATPESAWPVEKLLNAGYGLATFWYQDVFPDEKGQHGLSILSLFGYSSPEDNTDSSWQGVGAWAWGMSRAMDYFETDPQIDSKKIALMGHSRIGKAALWAGAQDERFALVVSNNSGCGGAALSKRTYGETIASMTAVFPHWFCKSFSQYSRHEELLPFDQHQLLALIAPRPLYVASAVEDRWADPRGEFLSAMYAGEVYRLYGYDGLNTSEMPALNTPIMNRVGYHIRTGGHAVTGYDWEQYILFADKWFKE